MEGRWDGGMRWVMHRCPAPPTAANHLKVAGLSSSSLPPPYVTLPAQLVIGAPFGNTPGPPPINPRAGRAAPLITLAMVLLVTCR